MRRYCPRMELWAVDVSAVSAVSAASQQPGKKAWALLSSAKRNGGRGGRAREPKS